MPTTHWPVNSETTGLSSELLNARFIPRWRTRWMFEDEMTTTMYLFTALIRARQIRDAIAPRRLSFLPTLETSRAPETLSSHGIEQWTRWTCCQDLRSCASQLAAAFVTQWFAAIWSPNSSPSQDLQPPLCWGQTALNVRWESWTYPLHTSPNRSSLGFPGNAFDANTRSSLSSKHSDPTVPEIGRLDSNIRRNSDIGLYHFFTAEADSHTGRPASSNLVGPSKTRNGSLWGTLLDRNGAFGKFGGPIRRKGLTVLLGRLIIPARALPPHLRLRNWMKDRVWECWFHRCLCRRGRQVQLHQEFITPTENNLCQVHHTFHSWRNLWRCKRKSSRDPTSLLESYSEREEIRWASRSSGFS